MAYLTFTRITLLTITLIVLLSTCQVQAITCYVCSPDNNHLCHPLELYGNETQCPEGVNVCYKSWSVEADPKTVRKCGDVTDTANKGSDCRERLQVPNKAIVCKCDTNLCNGSSTPVPWLIMLISLTTSLFILNSHR